MTIRRATDADVPALVTMAERFFAESEYRTLMTGDPDRIEGFARTLIDREDAAVFVSEGRVGVHGMLAILAFVHPFSGQRVASELVWWVDPEIRGAGVRLLRAAEQWATSQGAAIVQMIAPNARVGQFYTRVGYIPVEMTYQRRLQ